MDGCTVECWFACMAGGGKAERAACVVFEANIGAVAKGQVGVWLELLVANAQGGA